MKLTFTNNNILYNYEIKFNNTKLEDFKNILISCSKVNIESFIDDNSHADAELILSNIESCDRYANIVYNKHNNDFKAEITTYPVLYHILFGRYKDYNDPFVSLYLWLTNTVGIKENKDDLLYNSFLICLKATKNEDKYCYDKHISGDKKIWLCRKLFEALDIKLLKAFPLDEVKANINSIKKIADKLPSEFKVNTKDLDKKLNDANEKGILFNEIATRINIYIDEKGNILKGEQEDNLLLEKK